MYVGDLDYLCLCVVVLEVFPQSLSPYDKMLRLKKITKQTPVTRLYVHALAQARLLWR